MARKDLGYSLVELLVVSALLLLLMLGVSTLFITSLTSNARISLRQSLRAEGNFAMDTMTFFIRNARQLQGCAPNTPQLEVTTEDGLTTIFELQTTGTVSQIVATGGHEQTLTSDQYDVTNFVMNCDPGQPGVLPPYVTIDFTLERADSQGTVISNDFRHTVIVQNNN